MARVARRFLLILQSALSDCEDLATNFSLIGDFEAFRPNLDKALPLSGWEQKQPLSYDLVPIFRSGSS